MHVCLAFPPRRRGRLTPAASLAISIAVTAGAVASDARILHAHGGPPFTIVSDRIVGPYTISVLADPDTTDDGSPGGQFWVVLAPAPQSGPLPSSTRVNVSITPIDRQGGTLTGRAEPVDGDVTRQFVALSIDHEGRFRVRVAVEGPLGPAEVEADVDATYDERPPPIILALYLVPFLFVGFVGLKRLMARRTGQTRST